MNRSRIAPIPRPFTARRVSATMMTTALAGVLLASPAFAQQSRTAQLEEIIVTATKRGAETLQTVPIAVQAFTANEISDRLAVEFADLAGQVPALTFQDLGPGDKEYVIRGVNSTGIATVGVYYDEVEITGRNQQDGGGQQADIELHDLQRVEVLKGPQGTLYGASSMSGTIRFVPNAPNLEEIEGRVEGDVSTTDKGGENYRLNGTLNFPIVEGKMAIRAVGWITDESGFIDQPRINRENINSNNVEGGRIALRWLPTESLDITVAALVQNRKVGGSSRFTPSFDPQARSNLSQFPAIVDAFGGVLDVEGDLINQDFTRNNWDEDIRIFSAKAEWTHDKGSLLAAASYFSRDIEFNFDSSWILFSFGSPADNIAAAAVTRQPQSRDIFSTEVRYASNLDGPFNFVVGGILSREDQDFEVQVVTTNNLGLPNGEFRTDEDYLAEPDDPDFGPAVIGRFKDDKVDQEALFGEAIFDLTDRLTVTGGVRWYRWKSHTIAQETKPFGGFGASLEPIDVKEDAEEFTFKGNVSFQATDDVMVYATVSQGFRAGGINNPPVTDPTSQPELGFEPDKLTNYELGWKTSWLDNRVTFNGAVYYIDWKDIQIEDVDPTGAFPLIINAGDASVKGGEVELRATPVTGLNLFFGASYTEAKLEEDTRAAQLGLEGFPGEKGDRLPNVPKWQLSGAVQYAFPIMTDGLEGVLRADWSYRGATRIRFKEIDPTNVPLDSYHLVNLRAGLRGENWQASIYAKNVFDKRAQIDAVNTSQDPLAYITVRPATYGVNLSYNF